MDNFFPISDFGSFDTAHGSNNCYIPLLVVDSTSSILEVTKTSADSLKLVPVKPVKSIFKGHLLQPKSLEKSEVSIPNEDWIAIHLILVLFILAWVRLNFAKRLTQIFTSFIADRYQGMLSKEGNILREQISLGLVVVFLVITSLFYYMIATRLVITEFSILKGFKLYSIIFLGVLILWIIKNISITFLGHIFKNPVLLSEYVLTNFIFNVVLSIVLIPVLLIIIYVPSDEALSIGIIFFSLAHLYRIIREFFAALSYAKFSYVNRIIYLCTFEIAPVLVFIKLILNKLT